MHCIERARSRPSAGYTTIRGACIQTRYGRGRYITIQLPSAQSRAHITRLTNQSVPIDGCVLDRVRCLHCNVSFASYGALRRHIRSSSELAADRADIPIRCESCAREFLGLPDFYHHGLTRAPRPINCSTPNPKNIMSATAVSRGATSILPQNSSRHTDRKSVV